MKDGDNLILIASDARISIEGKYWEAFSAAREGFEGRDQILSSMMKREHAPSAGEVDEWYRRLVTMHDDLSEQLKKLLNLLERAQFTVPRFPLRAIPR